MEEDEEEDEEGAAKTNDQTQKASASTVNDEDKACGTDEIAMENDNS